MIEAVVQAGAFQIRYRRAGRGSTVLLVISDEDEALSVWLFAALGERFRTIAPALPPELQGGGGAFEAWLCAVSDGLGLERPGVVAGIAHARALQSLAARDPERLGRLVLLQRGDGPAAGVGAAPVPVPAAEGHIPGPPIRVVSVPDREDPADRARALARILEILRSRPDSVVRPGI